MADMSAVFCLDRAERGKGFTLEHPGNSIALHLDSWKRLMDHPDVHVIYYHTCMFEGSRRKKYQVIITNRKKFIKFLGKQCSGSLCQRTGLEHLRWRPTVSGGQVIQFQTGDEREYPIGFCKEYAKAAGEILAEGGTFVEVFSGPNAPLSVCVGNEMGVPVPGQKLEKRGEGDRRELQSLAQLLGSDPLPRKSISLGESGSNDPHRICKRTVVEVQANARPCQDVKNLNRSTAIQAARQPGYGKRVQLIADGLHDPLHHVERALQLRHPFNEENALKSDHQDALDGMATVEVMAMKHRMRVLGQWKSLAECKEVQKMQAEHEQLASCCAKKLGRKPRTALMEHLGRLYQVEDTAVPILCLTGMPIVGKALESPFFYSYHVPATVTVAELLKSAPLRRSSTLRRVKTMAESGTAEMAQAIWKKTLKEVDAGTMSGPYTLETMLEKHGRYLNIVPSFGLKQGEKYRRIDDHSASHNNLAAERTQQIHMAIVDYLMVMVSSMAKKFNTGLHIATEDMAGAYRQVPLTDSQVRISVTAVYDPQSKQPALFEIYGQPFGAAHAVPNFYRVAEWACRLMVRAYHLMVDHFFDDYFAVVRPRESQTSIFCLQEAFKLLGLVLDPEKSQPPSDFASVLGVAFNTRSLKEQKLLLVEPKASRVTNLTNLIHKILEDNYLSPSLAASLIGKFGFLCSTLFGKVGRCCTQSIRARQYGNPDEVALTRELRISLRLMELFVTTAPHRQLKLDHDLPPLILYTDASDVPGRSQGRWVVGAVLIDPNPMMIYYTSWIVPPSVVSSFLPKETYMGQLEILAAPIALNTWPTILHDRQVLLFIDNDAAAACLVRGYSPRQDSCALVGDFWLAASSSKLSASRRPGFTGSAGSTTQLPAIQNPGGPSSDATGSPSEVTGMQMEVKEKKGLPMTSPKVKPPQIATTAMTHSESSLGEAAAIPKPKRGSTKRSLVYGDRHPDQGLWHVDCSSMKNFVRGPFFETSFAILIMINTIFMALEYQFNGLLVGLEIEYPNLSTVTSKHWPWAKDTFEGAEWFFGLAFSGELLLKLGGLRCGFFKDPWNYLDVLIVMFWIIDVLPLDPMLIRILRLAKLLRLVKLAKSIKSFDSLYLLTASIASSASALVWSGVLICIVQLSVALVLSTFLLPYCTDLSIPEGDRFEVYRYFGTFSRSMLSMFELTLGNWVPISRILSEKVSEWYTIFTLAFQVILGFAVIKVITGVFLTETMKVASMDDSIMLKSKERAVRLHKEKMSRLFAHADLDANGGIDCVEFHTLLADREVRQWAVLTQCSQGCCSQVIKVSIADKCGGYAVKNVGPGHGTYCMHFASVAGFGSSQQFPSWLKHGDFASDDGVCELLGILDMSTKIPRPKGYRGVSFSQLGSFS
eukprot:s1234_g11.t1